MVQDSTMSWLIVNKTTDHTVIIIILIFIILSWSIDFDNLISTIFKGGIGVFLINFIVYASQLFTNENKLNDSTKSNFILDDIRNLLARSNS